jgi:hypothetical protein
MTSNDTILSMTKKKGNKKKRPPRKPVAVPGIQMPGVPGVQMPTLLLSDSFSFGPQSGGVPTTISQVLAGTLRDLGEHPEGWSEHLFYNFDQFFKAQQLIRIENELNASLTPEMSKALHNALLESFLMHERVIAEFFREPDGDEKFDSRHFYLHHYLDYNALKKWRSQHIPPDKNEVLRQMFTRAGADVAHPTRDRTHAESRESPKYVDVDVDVAFVKPIISAFLQNTDVQRKLSKNVRWWRVGGPRRLRRS